MEGNWGMSCHCPGQHTHSFTLTDQKLAEKPRFQSWLLHNWGISFYNCAFCWKSRDYFLSSGCGVTSAMAQCDIVTRVTSAVVQFDNCDKCDKCSGTVWRFPVVGTFVLLDGNDPNAPKASKCRPPAAGRRSWRHQVILTPFPSLQAVVHIINFGLEFSSNVPNV